MAVPTTAAPKRETDQKKRMVITGMGIVSVFGSDLDVYYEKLLEGTSGISLIDRFDASDFTVRFAGQIRDFTSTGYIEDAASLLGKRALEDAGFGTQILQKMDRMRIGVLVGLGIGGFTTFSNGVESLVLKGYKNIIPFFFPYSLNNMGSTLFAIDTGLMGPDYSISSACVTTNHCFYAAANHIRRGEVDIMVAGGTEAAIIPPEIGGFIACQALSKRNDTPTRA